MTAVIRHLTMEEAMTVLPTIRVVEDSNGWYLVVVLDHEAYRLTVFNVDDVYPQNVTIN